MRIINYGSLNIDLVYRVPHIVRPGETIASEGFDTFAGGKGANQSMALARAGASVVHGGCIGADGRWLVEKLAAAGVDTSLVEVVDGPSGHAVIQVDGTGENAIFLYAGANHRLDIARICGALGRFGRGDALLLQNEVNEVPRLIEAGHAAGLMVCLNPAPFSPAVARWPLEKVDLLVVNETEAAGLVGEGAGRAMLGRLQQRLGRAEAEVVLTLGAAGALYARGGHTHHEPAVAAQVLDTTAAGDTFIGYFLATRAAAGDESGGGGDGATAAVGAAGRALRRACQAAALCVSRPGAMDSIPHQEEVGG